MKDSGQIGTQLPQQLTALHQLYSWKDGYESRPGHPLIGDSYGLHGTYIDFPGSKGVTGDFDSQTVKINLYYDRFHDADLCNQGCSQGCTLPTLSGEINITLDANTGKIKEYSCGIEWEEDEEDIQDDFQDDERFDFSQRKADLESIREWESKALRSRIEELLREWNCLFS
jgi:hypothetical protein